jgi:Cu/Ag efflux pump CusA
VNQTIVIGPAISFRVDLEKAQPAGLSVTDVANLQAAIMDGQLASTLISGDRRIGIKVRYPIEERKGVDQLKALLMTSPARGSVPLAVVRCGRGKPRFGVKTCATLRR